MVTFLLYYGLYREGPSGPVSTTLNSFCTVTPRSRALDWLEGLGTTVSSVKLVSIESNYIGQNNKRVNQSISVHLGLHLQNGRNAPWNVLWFIFVGCPRRVAYGIHGWPWLLWENFMQSIGYSFWGWNHALRDWLYSYGVRGKSASCRIDVWSLCQWRRVTCGHKIPVLSILLFCDIQYYSSLAELYLVQH